MKCGWGCNAQLTGRNMRDMPQAAAGSRNGDCRTKSSKVKRGRPPGPRMKRGWGRGEPLAVSRMRPLSPHARGGRPVPTPGTEEGGTRKPSVKCGWAAVPDAGLAGSLALAVVGSSSVRGSYAGVRSAFGGRGSASSTVRARRHAASRSRRSSATSAVADSRIASACSDSA